MPANLKQKISRVKECSMDLLKRPQSIFNGLLGDRRFEQLNIEMGLYSNNKLIPLNKRSLKSIFKDQKNIKICLLVHGVMDDHQTWKPEGCSDYGQLLKEEFGFIPLYLRYNTGLHISQNGRSLSKLMEKLERLFCSSISEIIIIAHSMGGLVSRSACHYGKHLKWPKKVSRIFYLGCPHLGAPLEKFGNMATTILNILPYPFTNIAKNIINLRSSGIKDLRHGYLVDDQWKGKNPDSLFSNTKVSVPLHPDIVHFAISSIIIKNPQNFLAKMVGDSMVTSKSAFGQSEDENQDLHFYPEHLKQIRGLSHVGLTTSWEVYDIISSWTRESRIKPHKKGPKMLSLSALNL